MKNLHKQGKSKQYLFVIDTNSYAGNFERNMCGYVTGQTDGDEEGHGAKDAKIARLESPDMVSRLDDIIGCSSKGSPVSIFPNPKYGNNGHGKYALLTDQNRGEFSHPAFYSVAIHFDSIPDPDLLNLMKERAKHIAAKGVGLEGFQTIVEIEGFRLLEGPDFRELDIPE
jgi:hypothetical protein